MIQVDESSLSFGGNVSLTQLMEILDGASSKCDKYAYGKELAKHIDLVATVPVRNVRMHIVILFSGDSSIEFKKKKKKAKKL